VGVKLSLQLMIVVKKGIFICLFIIYYCVFIYFYIHVFVYLLIYLFTVDTFSSSNCKVLNGKMINEQ
jgi:hypothetical protein